MMAAFCQRMCWTDFSVLFMRICDKFNKQVKDELLDLMQIPTLRPERTRSLYENNLETIESVANLNSVQDLTNIWAKKMDS